MVTAAGSGHDDMPKARFDAKGRSRSGSFRSSPEWEDGPARSPSSPGLGHSSAFAIGVERIRVPVA